MTAASETTPPAPESQKHFVIHPRDCRSILCETISEKLPAWRQRISKLLKNNGDCKVSEVTVEQIYGGIRGVYTHVSDISFVDPPHGIRIRGYTIPELLSKLPADKENGIPILGGLYYLLLVDELPTLEDAMMVEDVWKSRSQVPGYVLDVLGALPAATHPMVMLSTAILAMQKDSLFSQMSPSKGQNHSPRKRWKRLCAIRDRLIIKIRDAAKYEATSRILFNFSGLSQSKRTSWPVLADS